MKMSIAPKGMFHPVTIVFSLPAVTLPGELFVPAQTHLVDVLNDSRRFLSVRNTTFIDSPETYSFLAVGKGRTQAVHFASVPLAAVNGKQTAQQLRQIGQ